ncbi:hypothetical protein D8M05_12665 [Oceanobacillus bengalensis]|uniref:Spore coat protein YutH n=1 Tax=Oceanobacillus bengalensis TaxID=1435466 RepID=A0A494YWF8_9BACI|nr:hypothetical protein [Oceanobacillus bengalensis]RKQ14482.1 hypothetical protein D8M05_12665 [Oceanobacillus bengalensis]
MPLSRFLSTYYDIQVEEKIQFDEQEGYLQDNYLYFITSIPDKEIVYMEQATIAYYLKENNYNHLSLPIPNIHGKWFTPLEDKKYIVLKVEAYREDDGITDGQALASFHQIGAAYQYQPKEISSYGNWRKLWIDKLTAFEMKIEEEVKKQPTDYYRLLMDVLPYLIGMSENAIQYARQSETDTRFHEADQGTFCFHRYHNQLKQPILWFDQLVYDHPARDIAEYIRTLLLNNEDDEEIVAFVRDYQSIHPLSVFSWRLVYSRLIFPSALFDFISRGFMEAPVDYNLLHQELIGLLEKQTQYERRLSNFYENLSIDTETLNIPVVNWL